ncbi:MAG: ATP-dependent endonuclease [Microbacterium sp.]|nr:ATP-dependent endonuclease [Microbacterium sp.]
MTRTVVLFEGASDRLAVEAASRRLGVGLDGLDLVDLDGITNLRAVLRDLLAQTGDVRVLGLYDAAEGAYVRRVLSDLGVLDATADPEGVGFFGCERDLEDEAIAAAGPDLVVETLDARGELARFRVFQGQPAQRERAVEDQLHRFAGTAAGRKARFAADVIDAIPLERMPRPLVALLDAALAE